MDGKEAVELVYAVVMVQIWVFFKLCMAHTKMTSSGEDTHAEIGGRSQVKKTGNKLSNKKIPSKKKVKKRMKKKMERKVKLKGMSKKKSKKKKRKKIKILLSKWSEKGLMEKFMVVMDVVTTWKALLSGEGDRATAVNMVDEVLKHLTIIGAPTLSGTTISDATLSQRASKAE
ncbi:hypothetical protein Scep_029869 [Stephania cephalantha]|uniref:Uncharacterized protein n=1 Tax=Stephania cephalantha TaxID=152367 RepID=A0AAP0HCP5_9MAGN